jgi:hypothetical protein
MLTVDEILEQARRLSPDDQRKLVEDLEANLLEADVDEARRLAALDRWLARAGSGRSDFTNVARDKDQRVSDAYAAKKVKQVFVDSGGWYVHLDTEDADHAAAYPRPR